MTLYPSVVYILAFGEISTKASQFKKSNQKPMHIKAIFLNCDKFEIVVMRSYVRTVTCRQILLLFRGQCLLLLILCLFRKKLTKQFIKDVEILGQINAQKFWFVSLFLERLVMLQKWHQIPYNRATD